MLNCRHLAETMRRPEGILRGKGWPSKALLEQRSLRISSKTLQTSMLITRAQDQSFWNSIFINRYRDINEKVPAPPTSRAVAPLWLARHFLCFRLMRNSDDRPPEISVR